MNINEIIHHQLEAAIGGLSSARDRIAAMKPDDAHEITRQIESAAFYLEDIQYNWSSLVQSYAAQRPRIKPNREAL